MDDPVFDHTGPWTEDAYRALAGNDGRVELVDGTLLVGPNVNERRLRAISRIAVVVQAALPSGLRLLRSASLRLGLDCVLIPDFVVTNMAVTPKPPAVLDAADALMVIEVIGREHGGIDRVFKPQLYARSRIPYSVLVDHDAPFATAEMIIGGRYHEYAGAGRGGVLRLEEPFRLELPLGALNANGEPAERSAPAAS